VAARNWQTFWTFCAGRPPSCSVCFCSLPWHKPENNNRIIDFVSAEKSKLSTVQNYGFCSVLTLCHCQIAKFRLHIFIFKWKVTNTGPLLNSAEYHNKERSIYFPCLKIFLWPMQVQ
jgi:hypothetical protein